MITQSTSSLDELVVSLSPGPKGSGSMQGQHKKYLPYIIFTLCAGLYMIPFMRLLLQAPDEGLLAYGAVRVTQGQVFARDFFEIVGPGHILLGGPVFQDLWCFICNGSFMPFCYFSGDWLSDLRPVTSRMYKVCGPSCCLLC